MIGVISTLNLQAGNPEPSTVCTVCVGLWDIESISVMWLEGQSCALGLFFFFWGGRGGHVPLGGSYNKGYLILGYIESARGFRKSGVPFWGFQQ